MPTEQKQARECVTTFTQHGIEVAFFLPDAEDHIQKCIARDRDFYEPRMLEHIRERAIPGTLAIDVGANIGNHTVFFGKVCDLQVIAFEPSQHCFDILTRNIELNGLEDSVTALRKAAGQSPGAGRVVEASPDNLGQTRVEKDPGGPLEIVPLDSLEITSELSLLKIDVEGMELEVLKGAAAIIRRFKPLIYVEAPEKEALRSIQAYLAQFEYGSVADFNWTPTYLFTPCRTPAQRFNAIMTRLERMELDAQEEVKNAKRWKTLADELREECRRALAEAGRWKDAAGDLGVKRASLLNDVDRWKASAHESRDQRRKAVVETGKWKRTADELKEEHRKAVVEAGKWKRIADELKTEHCKAVLDAEQWARAADQLKKERRQAHDDAKRWKESAQRLEADCRIAAEKIGQLEQQISNTQRECVRLSERSHQLRLLAAHSDRLQQELTQACQSKRYRIGDAMVKAAHLSWDTLRLPFRLWRIYRDTTPSQSNHPGVIMAEPVDQAAVAERHRKFLDDFREFATRVTEGGFSHVVVMFGGTTYIQGIRGNRPIRLTRSFERMGVPVLFNFHRLKETDHIPDYDGGLVFQSPIDKTPGLIERLVFSELGDTRGVLVVSYPHPSVCRLINIANVNGWATLYDCRDDWEEFEKVQMARWYKPGVERFVVNNCDVTCCVSRPLQEKLSGFTTMRPVHLSPNAYDPAFLSAGYEHRPGRQVRIGYFGHLTDRWFDWKSLRWIMEQRPSYQFEIIGHAAPGKLQLPANAELLGPRTHAEICQIASKWRVGIIPFRAGRLADGVDPIKIYEYFGLGLPVVSFRIPQIADYPYTTTVDTRADFVEALDQAIELECDPKVFNDFIAKHTWDNRARQMLHWADDALDRAPCEKTFHVAPTADG